MSEQESLYQTDPQSEQPEQQQEVELESAESTETSPTESQDTQEEAPSVDSIYRQVAQSAIERERRLQERLDELEARLTKVPETPAPNKEEDPIAYLQWQLDQKTAPVTRYIQQQERQQKFINNFTPVLQKYPALAAYQQQIMPAIWNVFANSNVEPTASAIETYTAAYVGQMLLQNPQMLAQQPQGTAPQNNRPPAPNRAPSTPPANRQQSNIPPEVRQAMKDLNFKGTEKEFMDYLNSPTRRMDY